jgi:hypothetical protein
MTPQEFRQAYLEAQNSLGNDLQSLVLISSNCNGLASEFNNLADNIQANYLRMNQMVEEYLKEQENQPLIE